mgnify:FL=1
MKPNNTAATFSAILQLNNALRQKNQELQRKAAIVANDANNLLMQQNARMQAQLRNVSQNQVKTLPPSVANAPTNTALSGGSLRTTYAQQNSFGTNYLLNGAKNNLQNVVAGAKKNASMSAKYQQLKGIFDQAQQRTGISSSLLAAIAANESGFNPNATGGPGTTVTGIFQIRPKDWSDGYKWGAKYGVSSTPSPKNNLQATLWVAGRFAKNRDSGYYQKLGISRPTDCDYYMTHFLGEGGYATLCRNLDKPAASVLPKEARYNKSIFYDKGRPRTGRQIKEFMLSKLKKRCAECGIPVAATMHM